MQVSEWMKKKKKRIIVQDWKINFKRVDVIIIYSL